MTRHHHRLVFLSLTTLFCGCVNRRVAERIPDPPGAVQVLPTSGANNPAPQLLPSTGNTPPVAPAASNPKPEADPEVAQGLLPAVEKRPELAAAPGTGRIVRVNERFGYVLLESSGRFIPGQSVVVLRDGVSVGKLLISTPRIRPYLSADILEGRPQPGDVVR